MSHKRILLGLTIPFILGACSFTSLAAFVTTPTVAPSTGAPAIQANATATSIASTEPAPQSQTAQRILSLAPSNTEILFAVGAGSLLVGRDSYSTYPPEAASVPDIGGGFTSLNMELILSRKPDLVLASPLTPPEQIADLQKAGLNVTVLPNPKTFDDLYANLKTAGQLTGHESDASGLVDALKFRVEAVTSALAQVTQKPVVYYELDATDPGAPYTSGPDTFIDLIIRTAGGENFGANLKGDWVQISVEELLSRQPDLIVLGDNTYGGVTQDQLKGRAGWEALKAVQQNQIFIFNDDLVSRPGPRLVAGLEAMAKILHPDLIK